MSKAASLRARNSASPSAVATRSTAGPRCGARLLPRLAGARGPAPGTHAMSGIGGSGSRPSSLRERLEPPLDRLAEAHVAADAAFPDARDELPQPVFRRIVAGRTVAEHARRS